MSVRIAYHVDGEIEVSVHLADGGSTTLYYNASIDEDSSIDEVDFEYIPTSVDVMGYDISELEEMAIQDAWDQINKYRGI